MLLCTGKHDLQRHERSNGHRMGGYWHDLQGLEAVQPMVPYLLEDHETLGNYLTWMKGLIKWVTGTERY